MNPELYERYLAKKAKKLGISVEELKAQGTSSPVKEESVAQTAQTAPQQTSTPEPQYVQRTIQDQLASETSAPIHTSYSGMQPETVKTEVPSYIFGPSRMDDTLKYGSNPLSEPVKPEIKDTRENKFGLIGYPLGHSLSKVIHEAGFKSLGINAAYDILETPQDSLVDRIKWLKKSI